MSVKTETKKSKGGGSFLTREATADEVFTREDLSPAQVMFGQIAEDFMNAEVVSNTEFKTYNTVASHRRIADSVVEAGRYYF
jgi:hypothetical protein